jgi:hypothetical protein
MSLLIFSKNNKTCDTFTTGSIYIIDEKKLNSIKNFIFCKVFYNDEDIVEEMVFQDVKVSPLKSSFHKRVINIFDGNTSYTNEFKWVKDLLAFYRRIFRPSQDLYVSTMSFFNFWEIENMKITECGDDEIFLLCIMPFMMRIRPLWLVKIPNGVSTAAVELFKNLAASFCDAQGAIALIAHTDIKDNNFE